jgi:hypothetical protein
MKTMPMKVVTIAATRPKADMREARRPLASKKTGLSIMSGQLPRSAPLTDAMRGGN